MPDPGPDQIPATSVNPAYWAVVQGRLAGAHLAQPEQVNPHRVCDAEGALKAICRGPVSQALALCWDYGFAGMPRARPNPDDTVSRGTSRPGLGGGGPERKGPLRPPRDDWRDHEIEVLRLARSGGQGKLTDRQLAVIVGKSHDAVRVKLSRTRARRRAQARSDA
jgi:hypothetical protein